MADPNADLIELSVLIPVSERHDDVATLFESYRDAIRASGRKAEFIYVLDGWFPEAHRALRELMAAGEPVQIVRLARSFGEATAINVGLEHAAGDLILLLPAYRQVQPAALTAFVNDPGEHDVLIARRWPRCDSQLNRLGTRAFHGLLRLITDHPFRDVGCGVRLIRREVLEELSIYGDQHRFLPILAAQKGFRVQEQDLPQAAEDPRLRLYQPGVYLRRVLDLLAVFFLVRFTKKPLRFFGLIGSAMFLAGTLVLLLVTFERLFLGESLADRPALLLGALLVVLGVQLFALGLIAELVIFTHARTLKEYAVAEVISNDCAVEETPASDALRSATADSAAAAEAGSLR